MQIHMQACAQPQPCDYRSWQLALALVFRPLHSTLNTQHSTLTVCLGVSRTPVSLAPATPLQGQGAAVQRRDAVPA